MCLIEILDKRCSHIREILLPKRLIVSSVVMYQHSSHRSQFGAFVSPTESVAYMYWKIFWPCVKFYILRISLEMTGFYQQNN